MYLKLSACLPQCLLPEVRCRAQTGKQTLNLPELLHLKIASLHLHSLSPNLPIFRASSFPPTRCRGSSARTCRRSLATWSGTSTAPTCPSSTASTTPRRSASPSQGRAASPCPGNSVARYFFKKSHFSKILIFCSKVPRQQCQAAQPTYGK